MKCFACDRPLGRGYSVRLADDDHRPVTVGMDCFDHIAKAGAIGWQPPKGGPRLFRYVDDARAAASGVQEGGK
jgi:hypothetical protein